MKAPPATNNIVFRSANERRSKRYSARLRDTASNALRTRSKNLRTRSKNQTRPFAERKATLPELLVPTLRVNHLVDAKRFSFGVWIRGIPRNVI